MTDTDHAGHRHQFKVFGFPVHVGWQFFLWPLIAAGIRWRTPEQVVEWLVVVFLSVLLHELGHAFAYRRAGSPARIQLWSLGGLTWGSTPRTRSADVAVTLAGPIPPLVLVGLPAYLAYRHGVFMTNPFWRQTLLDLWWVNLFWSAVNLVPLLPLDGGRLVAKVWGRTAARIASIAFGATASIACLVVWSQREMAFMALILTVTNIISFDRERKARGSISGFAELPGGMWVTPGPAREDVDRQPAVERPSRWVADLPVSNREIQGWVALERGDDAEAAKLLARLGPIASPVFAGAVLARQGKASAAVAAYGTGIAAGAAFPPVADAILADQGLSAAVAEWIVAADPEHGHQTLLRLSTRLHESGHTDASADVGAVWATAAP
jgi:Zn-dependent protease